MPVQKDSVHVLLQCEHPVYFSSKALTDSQKGYVAIELEALAVSWAMEKIPPFSCMLQKFVLENRPEKPLENNIGKKSECSNTMDYRGNSDKKHLPMTSP